MSGKEQLQLDAPPVPVLGSLSKDSSPSVHLDALRGLAAFCVLLSHWRDAFFVDFPPIRQHNAFASSIYVCTELAHQWVIVFFVMSGYLVGGSVLRAVESRRWKWSEYLLRRLSRLYTVLLPALLFGGALDWAGSHLVGAQDIYSGHSGMYSLAFDVYPRLTFPVLISNALFLQNVVLRALGGRIPTFGSNGPLWSLGNEFWYYLAFPLVTLMLTKGRSWRSRLACGLGLAFCAKLLGTGVALLGIPWLMGALIGFVPSLPVRRPWIRRLAVVTALVLFGISMLFGRFAANTGESDILIGLATAALILVTVQFATSPLPRTYVMVAKRSARSSYTLYLAHYPMIVFLKAVLHMPRAVPDWHSLPLRLGLLAATLLYAQLLYELFEKHTDSVRKWIGTHLMGGRSPKRSLATK